MTGGRIRATGPAAGAALLGVVAAWVPLANAAPSDSPSVLVKLARVQERVIRRRLRAYGTIEPDPDRQASIVIPIQGIVGDVSVKLGEIVPAGAPLLEVNTAPAASAAFEQARAALTYARRAAQRTSDLYKKGFATKAQYDTSQRDLINAQSQFNAQLTLGNGATKMALKAPFTGIIDKLSVAAGDRVSPNTLAVAIVPRDAMVVPLGVEPEDAARLKVGQRVDVRAIFGRSAAPSVGRISAIQAIVDPTTGLVNALVHLDPKDAGRLLIGERVEGRIILSEQKMPAAPRSAVLANKGTKYLFLVKDGRAHRVSVTVGSSDGDYIGIRKGISPGDEVVAVGNYELADGGAVRTARQ